MVSANILLVEDDDVLRDLVLRNLQARQHQVWEAVNAQETLAYLRRQTFDLVLLDINLPDKTGWDILRIARKECLLIPCESQEQLKLPVVILSAVRPGLSRLTEFQPLACLPKPFPMEALLRLATEAAQRKISPSAQKDTHTNRYVTYNEEELRA